MMTMPERSEDYEKYAFLSSVEFADETCSSHDVLQCTGSVGFDGRALAIPNPKEPPGRSDAARIFFPTPVALTPTTTLAVRVTFEMWGLSSWGGRLAVLVHNDQDGLRAAGFGGQGAGFAPGGGLPGISPSVAAVFDAAPASEVGLHLDGGSCAHHVARQPCFRGAFVRQTARMVFDGATVRVFYGLEGLTASKPDITAPFNLGQLGDQAFVGLTAGIGEAGTRFRIPSMDLAVDGRIVSWYSGSDAAPIDRAPIGGLAGIRVSPECQVGTTMTGECPICAAGLPILGNRSS